MRLTTLPSFVGGYDQDQLLDEKEDFCVESLERDHTLEGLQIATSLELRALSFWPRRVDSKGLLAPRLRHGPVRLQLWLGVERHLWLISRTPAFYRLRHRSSQSFCLWAETC